MKSAELKILERAFDAEVSAALKGGIHLLQTKSAMAKRLESGGYLRKATIELDGHFPMAVTGYELTHLGRMTYCMSCDEDTTK